MLDKRQIIDVEDAEREHLAVGDDVKDCEVDLELSEFRVCLNAF